METTTTGVGFDGADLKAMLRRRWWLIVLAGLIGLGLAIVAGKVIQPAYAATTTVQITPTGAEQASSGNVGQLNATVNPDTEVQIATSATVAQRAKAILHTAAAPDALLANLTVSVPANTTVLSIQCTADTPHGAQDCAKAFATAYLANRKESAEASIANRVQILNKQLSDLKTQDSQLHLKAASLSATSPDRAFVLSQITGTEQLINQTNQTLLPLLQVQVSPGSVLTEPELPTGPTQPVVLYLPVGLLVGLIIGFVIALILERSDRWVRRGLDVERLADIPLLGEIPSAGRVAPTSIAVIGSRTGQAFGQVRNAVVASLPSRPATLLVTSAAADSPANSVTAANLAAALVRAGAPVVLVCADPAHSTAAELVGVGDAPGLAEALLEGADPLDLLVQSPTAPGLLVLTPGVRRSEAVDHLQTRRAEQVFAAVRRDSYLVLEAPSTVEGADAQAMARVCDAAVLVVEIAHTRRMAVLDAARQIGRVGTPLLGALVFSPIRRGKRSDSAAPVSRPAARVPRAERPPVSLPPSDVNNSSESRSYPAAEPRQSTVVHADSDMTQVIPRFTGRPGDNGPGAVHPPRR
jgi:capsular polysaccharide biosynthesis protein/Mrp family chromosome partitioning ATPase